MSGIAQNLNLNRLLRPTTFEAIVGQPLVVRVLKNSLYRSQLFPVYLFAGQRGCGKTTTARIFATAVNCRKLPDFRVNPRSTPVPCYACDQCKAMRSGSHPDFFEIDAASNTGVEHVRGIIESCSFCPVMGEKKLYLIDEVHMLSKSAFNALLKLLEEPPDSVLFVLATTDPEKIPDTVRSRCFILQFNPIEIPTLSRYLASICDTQQIRYQVTGLDVIARCSSGSARDAINLLERVRFASSEVTPGAVRAALGHVADETIITLLRFIACADGASLCSRLHYLQEQGAAPAYVWSRLKECVRGVLWVVHGADLNDFIEHISQMKSLAQSFSVAHLSTLIKLFCTYEVPFKRAADQFLLLELLLLGICLEKKSNIDLGSGPSIPSVPLSVSSKPSKAESEAGLSDNNVSSEDPLKTSLISKLVSLKDPLIISIVEQIIQTYISQDKRSVRLVFSENMKFFGELFEQTRKAWEPIVLELFGSQDALSWEFTAEPKKNTKSLDRTRNAMQSKRAINEKAPTLQRASHGAMRKSRSHISGGTMLSRVFSLYDYKIQKLSSELVESNMRVHALLTALSGTLYSIERVIDG